MLFQALHCTWAHHSCASTISFVGQYGCVITRPGAIPASSALQYPLSAPKYVHLTECTCLFQLCAPTRWQSLCATCNPWTWYCRLWWSWRVQHSCQQCFAWTTRNTSAVINGCVSARWGWASCSFSHKYVAPLLVVNCKALQHVFSRECSCNWRHCLLFWLEFMDTSGLYDSSHLHKCTTVVHAKLLPNQHTMAIQLVSYDMICM